jgi:hypothetical protein
LLDAVRTERDSFVASRLLGHGYESPPWATLAAMDAEAQSMEDEGNPDHAEMLKTFRAHLATKMKRASELLGLN